MVIYFYGAASEPHGCFSNFAPYGFEAEGYYWLTNEHFFQAMKFQHSLKDFEAVNRASTPKIAASIGRDRKRPLRADWETVKDDIMRRGVLLKFSNHAEIRQILLDTGEESIVENAPRDYYWGCGASGIGKNKLGLILVETRDLLRSEAK